MRTTRTAAAIGGAAVVALLAGVGGAVADTGSTSATPAVGSTTATPTATPTTGAKGPSGDGARALCRRLPRVDARIDRALKRLDGPVTRRGSIARLNKRVDNAEAAGHTAVATYLKDRLTFRTSLVTTLNQRKRGLDAVRTWCGTQHMGPAKSASGTGTAK